MKVEEVLKQCTVEGNIVKLPDVQLDRKLYLEVKKALELIGGKWKGGKVAGFVFNEDPTEMLAQVASGEKRNLKKEYQFFATPDELADMMVDLAQLSEGDSILEPEAGQGAIVRAIIRDLPALIIDVYELMSVNRKFLERLPVVFKGEDFFKCTDKYDKIIANPPFTKNQDIDHIRKMYDCLLAGGRLVTLASESWVSGSQKKQVAFREWLDEVEAEIIDIKKGTFKESGTMVGAKLIVIQK